MLLLKNSLAQNAAWRRCSGLLAPHAAMATIQTSQVKLLRKPEQLPKYALDRDYFKTRAQFPDYEAHLRNSEQKAVAEAVERSVLENKFNDRNPQNIVPVTINSPLTTPAASRRRHNLQPFILRLKKRPEKQIVVGIRRKIPSTVKKMRKEIYVTQKKHVLDALQMLSTYKTKTARYLEKAILQTVNHAKLRGWKVERLYIHGIIVGRQRRFKHIRYHAKSKHGILKRQTIQLRVELEHKPIKDMYKLMFQGKAPPSLAFLLRQQILEQGLNYEHLAKYQPLLTAKGRQQTRMFMKRRAIQRQIEFKKFGQEVPFKILYEKVVTEEAEKWAVQYEQRQQEINQESLTRRMAVFKKNQESTR